MSRPQTLKEAIERILAGEEERISMGEFLDTFYLSHGKIAEQQAMIDPVGGGRIARWGEAISSVPIACFRGDAESCPYARHSRGCSYPMAGALEGIHQPSG
jgi:hypothetical protein